MALPVRNGSAACAISTPTKAANIRERLLTLSDREQSVCYCILSTLPGAKTTSPR